MINKHVNNVLPVRLLYVENFPKIQLVTRAQVQALLVSVIDKMASRYLEAKVEGNPGGPVIGELITTELAYTALSHRWLSHGEVEYPELRSLEQGAPIDLTILIPPEEPAACGIESATDLHDIYSTSASLGSELKDIRTGTEPSRARRSALLKLWHFCRISKEMGFNYAWLDTACIDKTSSTELDESIRSMFRWYRDSSLCIVHLARSRCPSDFDEDPWFTRGWTLQELLAPERVKFFNDLWQPFSHDCNDKQDTLDEGKIIHGVAYAAGISIHDLTHFQPGRDRFRDVLAWAARRETARLEDRAYCLIGVLDIYLSPAYGEGRASFHRLQVELLNSGVDRSLFLWQGWNSKNNSFLALSPMPFYYPHAMWPFPPLRSTIAHAGPYSIFTNYALRLPLSIYNIQNRVQIGWRRRSEELYVPMYTDEHPIPNSSHPVLEPMSYRLEVEALGPITLNVVAPRLPRADPLRDAGQLKLAIIGYFEDNSDIAEVGRIGAESYEAAGLLVEELSAPRRYKRVKFSDWIRLTIAKTAMKDPEEAHLV